MKKCSKIILGIATFWQSFYLICFFIYFSCSIIHGLTKLGPSWLFDSILSLFIVVGLNLVSIFMGIILLIIYIVHLLKNDKIKNEKRLMYLVFIIILGIFAMPIYWYFYIWKDQMRNRVKANYRET